MIVRSINCCTDVPRGIQLPCRHPALRAIRTITPEHRVGLHTTWPQQHENRADTADGLALVAALAVDDRIPARQRFEAISLLFKAGTVAERHLAETGPATPRQGDPDSEARARSAVQDHVPDLLARWPSECPAVRLALAGLAVVFPTDRTLAALRPRLRTFVDRHPQGTDIGDYARFVLVLAAQDDDRILTVTEKLTEAYWTGTARGVPTRPRALHLLGQMLTRVRSDPTRPRAWP
ncbi:hypothetical protein [Streptomyces laurentii]|uniref:hypothetical protein n=1 Tax=Streptomyces laurentii TaxID=39478 RepID=UPI0036C7DCD5